MILRTKIKPYEIKLIIGAKESLDIKDIINEHLILLYLVV